jgi:hypothetical protein
VRRRSFSCRLASRNLKTFPTSIHYDELANKPTINILPRVMSHPMGQSNKTTPYTSTTSSVVPLSHSGRHRFTTLVKKSRVLFRVFVWTRSPHAEKRTFQYNRQHRVKICVISIANNCCFGVVPNVVIIGKRGANFISCFLIIHPL